MMSYVLQKEKIEEGFARDRQKQARVYAAVCRQAMASKNELSLLNHTNVLKSLEGVDHAYFADRRGKIVSHSDPRWIYQPLAKWAALPPADVLEERFPVEGADGGEVVIGFSKAHQKAALEKALTATLWRVSWATLLVGGAGLAAAFLFSTLLTTPLRRLAEGSEKIAAGDFQTQVPVAGADEVGLLTERFNKMAQSLAVLDELKDEFISSVSHDLRTPLTAIHLHIDGFLKKAAAGGTLTSEDRDNLKVVKYNALRLGLFVNNVLDAAKMKAGRLEFHPGPVDLEEIARNMQKLFGVLAAEKKMDFVAEIPLGLPPLLADLEHVENALANLLSNAFKFTPEGGRVTLSAREDGARLLVSVQDTGAGIKPEDLSTLFERFRQVDAAAQRAKRIKGTGLGLHIVKKTVEAMGGAIAVDSRPGQGTRFTLAFPKAARP
jgi:signal transduction histidine kinase